MNINNCYKILFQGGKGDGKTNNCALLLNELILRGFIVEEFYVHTPNDSFKRLPFVKQLIPQYTGVIRQIWDTPLLADSTNFSRFQWDNNFLSPDFINSYTDFCAKLKYIKTGFHIIIFSCGDLQEQVDLLENIVIRYPIDSVIVAAIRKSPLQHKPTGKILRLLNVSLKSSSSMYEIIDMNSPSRNTIPAFQEAYHKMKIKYSLLP